MEKEKRFTKIIAIICVVVTALACLSLVSCKKKNTKNQNAEVNKMIIASEKVIVTATSDVFVTDGGVKVLGYKQIVEIGENETTIREITAELSTTQELKEKETYETVTEFNRESLISFSFEEYMYKTFVYKNGQLTATVAKDRVDNVLGYSLVASSDGELTATFENGLIKDLNFTFTMEDGKVLTLVATYQYKV